MTKQDQKDKYVDRALIDIPDDLRKLDLAHVENIRVSIKAKGHLIPVMLKPTGAGRFRLCDGQHRLAALDAEGIGQIKYELTTDDDAGDVANMVRKQFTFSERIKVVSLRPEDSDAALASALGVTERKVKQYRALATLPQAIIDAVEDSTLSESIAQRVTVMPGDMVTEITKALGRGTLPYWCDTLEDVKEELIGRRIPTAKALFDVEMSGLIYERDLFDTEGGFFHDKKEFMIHQSRAAEEIAKTLTDEVVVCVGNQPNGWHSVKRLREEMSITKFLKPGVATLLKDMRARLKEVVTKISALKGVHDEALRDAKNGMLAEIASVEDNPQSYDKTKIPAAKVLVWIQNDGDTDFKIYVPAKAAAQMAPKSKNASTPAPAKPFEPHTKKAWRIARDHRSIAVQTAMINDPLFAMRLLLAGVIDGGRGLFGVTVSEHGVHTEVPSHIEKIDFIEGIRHREEAFAKMWADISVMTIAELTLELARFIAPAACVTGYEAEKTSDHSDDKPWLIALAAANAITPVPPLPHEYFDAHQSAQLLKLIKDMKGVAEAKLYEGKPKKVLVAAAHSFATETSWFPKLLDVKATPASKSKASEKKPAKAKAKSVPKADHAETALAS